MTFKKCLSLIIILLVLDQVLKIYIKTHFYLGQEVALIGNWCKLHFIENEGMAFGIEWGGYAGKIALTTFRIIASVVGFRILYNATQQPYSNAILISGSLILAGAIGNLTDSIFYGQIFNESFYHSGNIAQLLSPKGGYAPLLQGRVVDMFYFPIIESTYPTWVPTFGGQPFIFFRMIFNIADACISVGVCSLILLQRRLLFSNN